MVQAGREVGPEPAPTGWYVVATMSWYLSGGVDLFLFILPCGLLFAVCGVCGGLFCWWL